MNEQINKKVENQTAEPEIKKWKSSVEGYIIQGLEVEVSAIHNKP